VNEAALLAARMGRRLVTMSEFEASKDKVMMGAERRSMVMSDEEKKLTAYHEAGHALVAFNVPASDPIHKATIIPRGRALGMVMRLPEHDRISTSREKLEGDITVAMGGRIAEELIFGHGKVTSGAAQDIEMATRLARTMVTKFGMSDAMGPLSYGENEEEVFLGHSVQRTQNISEKTAEQIDSEIRRLVNEGYQTARGILEREIDSLHELAKGLLEFETLSGDEIGALLRGEQVARDEAPAEAAATTAVPSSSGRKPAGKNKGAPGGLEPEPQPGS
jgi:cell division protease FtsH